MTETRYQLYIGGKFVNPKNPRWFDSNNPFTNKNWVKIPQGTSDDVDFACKAAKEAFPSWAGLHSSERAKYLHRLADLIEQKIDHLAEIEVRDNGKILPEMKAQMAYLPKYYRYFAALGETLHGKHLNTDKPDHHVYTIYEPLGVIAAMIPWNSPLLLLTWKMAPALAAGNTFVFKPSEYASASSLEFAKLIHEAGFPPGVVNIISGFGPEAGHPLVTHPDVAKVTFTGGTELGAYIYKEAASHLKPVVMELGGKSANIVFADADLDAAVPACLGAIFVASGQSCIAGSRLVIERKIYEPFVKRLLELAKGIKLGDPMNPATQIGPVTTPSQFEKILKYIEIGKQEGAKCVFGGQQSTRPECKGSPWFIEPTIFIDVKNSMRIAQEEIFGPVLCIIPVEDEEEAIRVANDTKFGLAAGIWTQDMRKALSLPKQLKAGTIWVNTYRVISYLTPFGGFKSSGFGREAGEDAIYEFLANKSVLVNLGEQKNPFVIK